MSYSLDSTGTILAWHASDNIEPLLSTVIGEGYTVTAAIGQEDVLAATLQTLPDMLLISLQASGEEGYALCRVLRSLEITRLLPIVFVGTRCEQSELVNVLRCGGSDYVQLPMDAEESWLRISRHLHTAQVMRQLQVEKASLNKMVSAYDQMIQRQEAIRETLAEENRNLQRLAYVDGLTQVANRYSFNQTIVRLWKDAYQQGQPVSLLLCDIDYFKRYNDTYGHLQGDRCLHSVAQAIVRGAHRQEDYVARYGGEEFAVLLPSTDLAGAQQVAKAVQQEVMSEQIPHRASLVQPQVSLSIGICTLTPDSLDMSHEVLIHGADEALYTAKLRGRNLAVANTHSGLVSIAPAAKSASTRYSLSTDACQRNELLQLATGSKSTGFGSTGSKLHQMRNLLILNSRETVRSL